MTTEDFITELFCSVDDVLKEVPRPPASAVSKAINLLEMARLHPLQNAHIAIQFVLMNLHSIVFPFHALVR